MVDANLASDPVRTLLAYDRWANTRVLDRCADLSEDDFRRGFDIGVGSLHEQSAHIVLVLGVWTDVLEGRPMREKPDDLPWERERLGRELSAAHDAFDCACDGPMDDTFVRPYRDAEFRLTRASIATHVPTHNAHHRAQCLHMLKRLGMETPMPASLIAWALDLPLPT